MKLIENTVFETITSDLASMENTYRLEARLESYSCKTGTSLERKAYKSFVSHSSSSAPDKDKEWLSPPDCHISTMGTSPSSTATGPAMCDTICKKTFWYLVATLNASYGMEDGDFSDVQSQMFSREPSVQEVMDRVNVNFTTVLGSEYDKIKPYVWKAIDESIVLRDCTVYSFSPDACYDPYAEEHSLWKFWYFFYNHSLKRVCFFQCRAIKSTPEPSEWDLNNQFELEEEFGQSLSAVY